MTRLLCLALLFVGVSCAGTANRDMRRMSEVLVSPELVALELDSGVDANRAVSFGDPYDAPLPASQEPTELNAKYADLGIGPPQPWRYMQGYIGVNFLDEVTREGGTNNPVEGDFDEWPVIGGGAQWVLGGSKRLDLGLEGMINFGGRANAVAFRVGGGGAAVAVDVDMLAIDFYGGPFASTFIGEKIRVYGSLGPMIQFVNYDENDTSGPLNQSGSGSGFGTGLYARTGAEIRVRPGTLVGLGVRWIDSHVDLDSNLGDLDITGVEVFFSVTQF